jgi:hypothetical protein
VQKRFWGAYGSLLSLLAWWILSPLMATVGICTTQCYVWESKPLLVRTLGQYLAGFGVFRAENPDDLYFGFGSFFWIIYFGLVLTVYALHHFQLQRGASSTGLLRFGYWVLLIGFVICALGDFTSYGIGAFSKIAWSYGFGVEVFSWIAVSLGSICYAIASLRLKLLPSWVAWLILLAGVLLPLTLLDFYLVAYAPNAQLLPVVHLWAAVGIYLLRQSPQSQAQLQPAV